ncbi:MAG TPA: alpha/beta fold hydrolase [Opitutaceae bacterium]|nr:alpha/beta fold hydrolase [Opitutaceae bacterium]
MAAGRFDPDSQAPRRAAHGWPSRAIRGTLLIGLLAGLAPAAVAADAEHVILVHGLWRSSRSMMPMQEALEEAGFVVLNLDYPSRTATIEELSEETIGPALEKCLEDGATKVHFVTHSLGGILVRSYFSRHSADNVGRVVMLGPPNQGSEAIDVFEEFPLFDGIMGPAALELGTDDDSVPNTLGKPAFPVGIIAGNRSLNPVESVLIPGSDDSKVSVERTMLDGMTDHIVVPTTHPFMMRNARAIRETIHFLTDGRFSHTVMEPMRRPSRRR